MEPQQTPAPDPVTQAALRSLKDIAVPPPVSWMPQTWGWACLAAILAAMLLAAALIWLRHYRANAYRRKALQQLDAIEQRMQNPAARLEAVQELARLLKQVALASVARSAVASLSGAAWVAYMDSRAEGGAGNALGQILDDGEYHATDRAADMPSNGSGALIKDARTWIEKHHVSA